MTAPKMPSKKILLPVLVIFLILVIAGGAFAYTKMKSNKNSASDVSALVVKVGKLIELPSSETPTVATVSDINKLKGQPFFAHAVNGDKVLIFEDAKKAILYRPSENKIIEVAVYNPAQAAQNGASATPSATKVQVVIYNGTKTVGLAKKEQTALESKYPNIETTGTGNASGDYAKDLVVDLSGKNAAFAKTLANDLNGEVGSLPSAETKPDNADLLIILGATQ